MDLENTKEILINLNFPSKEIADLLSISKIKKISNRDYFLCQGNVPKKFAIVLSGIFRYYYIHNNGDEFTKGFIISNQILVSYSAMRFGKESLFYIQALEDSFILEIDYKKWLQLQEKNSFWDKFLITALEKGYYKKEKRERELLLLDAEVRYKIFLEEFPDLFSKVQLQIIASYLGIKPESLSRIRKKIEAS